MHLSDFDYELPEELIAQEPPAERDAARMLVLHRDEQRFEDRQFREFPSFLREGDCVVLNDSRVLPRGCFAGTVGDAAARTGFRRSRANGGRWFGRAANYSSATSFVSTTTSPPRSSRMANAASAPSGSWAMKMSTRRIDRLGHMPLPPYIKRADRPADRDVIRPFSRANAALSPLQPPGCTSPAKFSIACAQHRPRHPACGARHISTHRARRLRKSPASFRALLDLAEMRGGRSNPRRRVVAVGTTSVRTLESAALSGKLIGLDQSLHLSRLSNSGAWARC